MALCKDLYFNTEDFSTTDLILVNGTLYFIFRTYSIHLSSDKNKTKDLDKYTSMFAQNLEALIGELSLMLEPSDENIEALLLGVSTFLSLHSKIILTDNDERLLMQSRYLSLLYVPCSLLKLSTSASQWATTASTPWFMIHPSEGIGKS